MLAEKKKTKRKPTPKQLRAVKLTLENLGLDHPKTQSQILQEAGYSANVANKMPADVVESDTFKELMAKHLPESLLTRKHEALFHQKQLNYFTFPKDMSDDEIISHVEANGLQVIVVRESDKGKLAFYSIDDVNAIKSALDMGYKLRGNYAPEKQVVLNAYMLPDEEKSRIDNILNDND